MKQKLFENVGGNNFRLITENVEESKSKNVREGIRKVFSTGKDQISYRLVQNVGLGYIKDVNEAKKCALQEARVVAEECGYMEDEGNSKFIKKEAHDETNTSNPTENREITIGNEIIRLAKSIKEVPPEYPNKQPSAWDLANSIEALAKQLIKRHGYV